MPSAVGIGVPGHKALMLELLHFAGDRGSVDPEQIGQGGHAQRLAVDVELVEQGCSGPVEPHTGRLQQALMQPGLGHRPGHYLEGGFDLVDRAVGRTDHGRPWVLLSYLRHTKILADSPELGDGQAELVEHAAEERK